MTSESRVTWRGERERSWESRGLLGRSGRSGRSMRSMWSLRSFRSVSLLDMSTGVRLSRKVSMSAVSLAEGALSARWPVFALLVVVVVLEDDTGGNRPGGVCGRGRASLSLDRAELADGGDVLMFRSGFRRELRRAVSEEACIVE